MKSIIKSGLLSLFAATSLTSAFAQTYDATSGFGSPQWKAGYRAGPACANVGGMLTTPYNPAPGISGLAFTSPEIPLVARNTTSAPVTFSSVTVPANSLFMHPGTKGECATLRFKAQIGGQYTINGSMASIDNASPNEVRGYIYGPGGALLQGPIVLNSNNVTGTTVAWPTVTINLAANQTIDFALDEGTNIDPLGPFRFDSTKVTMTLVRKGGPGNGDNGDNSEAENGGNIPVLSCSKSQNNPVQVNLSTGQPGWTLKLPNGSPSSIVPTPSMVPSPWTAVAGAQWVGPQGAPQAAGNYVYETRVRVLRCPDGRPARIKAQFRADNIGTLTLLDPAGGVISTMNQTGTYNYGFLPASLSPANGPGVFSWVVPTNGIYTIRMSVQNSGGPTGLAANVVVSR